jgi:hypothetical protein
MEMEDYSRTEAATNKESLNEREIKNKIRNQIFKGVGG